jgi:hypothetical protein
LFDFSIPALILQAKCPAPGTHLNPKLSAYFTFNFGKKVGPELAEARRA